MIGTNFNPALPQLFFQKIKPNWFQSECLNENDDEEEKKKKKVNFNRDSISFYEINTLALQKLEKKKKKLTLVHIDFKIA